VAEPPLKRLLRRFVCPLLAQSFGPLLAQRVRPVKRAVFADIQKYAI